MASNTPAVKLNTGASFPAIGLGTWQGRTTAEIQEVKAAILEAIKLGYRHIDTAYLYNTERAVGEAIRESGIPREEFFVTTKLWGHHHRHVAEGLDKSLATLGLDYVDLYLMHWPISYDPASGVTQPKNADGSFKLDRENTFVDTWRRMEALPKSKARAIGISNFMEKNIETLLKEAKVIPAANQVELHPYLQQISLKKLCDSKGIVLTAYSPFGQNIAPFLEEPILKSVAQKHGISVGQAILSWIVSRGDTTCPKSGNPKRLKENFEIVRLDENDLAEIAKLDRHRHLVLGKNPGDLVFGWTQEELGW